MSYLPVGLLVDGRHAVVVGGGTVAARKAAALLDAGARVTVISPALAPELVALAARAGVAVWRRPYAAGDLAGADLAVAATGDPAVNLAVCDEARARRVPVNAAGEPEAGSFAFAASVRRGPLTIAVLTDGQAPALSRRVRQELEAALGPEYTAFAELLADLRRTLHADPALSPDRRQAILSAVAQSEVLGHLAAGRRDLARAAVEQIRQAH